LDRSAPYAEIVNNVVGAQAEAVDVSVAAAQLGLDTQTMIDALRPDR
jgi:hypothetical protein